MIDDFDLIISSFASEYGIRIYSADFKKMKWDEFCSLLSGLSAESPLGRIVQIRSETDKKIIRKFNNYQRKIYSDWQKKKVKNISIAERDRVVESMKQLFIGMAK